MQKSQITKIDLAGKEIGVEIIYPVAFIAKELAESRLSIRQLDKKIAKDNKISSKTKIALHFIYPDILQIDKGKLIQAIEEAALTILADQRKCHKVKLYSALLEPRNDLIDQLIISEFTIRLLDRNEENFTKAAFESIKKRIFNIVNLKECSEHGICKFSLDIEKLQNGLNIPNIKVPDVSDNKDMTSIECAITENGIRNRSPNSFHSEARESNITRLLSADKALIPFDGVAESIRSKTEINTGLLINVIEAYAFRYHNLDVEATSVHVLAKRRLANISAPRWIKRYMKWDLQPIGFSENTQEIEYGMSYKLKKGFLRFFGIVDNEMER